MSSVIILQYPMSRSLMKLVLIKARKTSWKLAFTIIAILTWSMRKNNQRQLPQVHRKQSLQSIIINRNYQMRPNWHSLTHTQVIHILLHWQLMVVITQVRTQKWLAKLELKWQVLFLKWNRTLDRRISNKNRIKNKET